MFSSDEDTMSIQSIVRKYATPNKKNTPPSSPNKNKPLPPSKISNEIAAKRTPSSTAATTTFQFNKLSPSFGSIPSALSPIVYFPFVQDKKWIVVLKEIPGLLFQVKPEKQQLLIAWTIEGILLKNI